MSLYAKSTAAFVFPAPVVVYLERFPAQVPFVVSVSQALGAALSSTATAPTRASPVTGELIVTDGVEDAPFANPVVLLQDPSASENSNTLAALASTAPDKVTVTLSLLVSALETRQTPIAPAIPAVGLAFRAP